MADKSSYKGFNPIKETVDGKRAHSVVWTTKSLDMAIEGLNQGKKLVANPFYENNTKILKGDLVFQRTPEEEAEFIKCMNDIVYFANTYCKLMTPEGVKKVEMRDYQRDYLKHLEKNQLSIFLSCRQSAKTTTSAIFLLHYILFNVDKNTLVLGNKRRTSVEILDKVKNIFYEIPYFLKPGVYKWNESEIVLDNGCRCLAEATTINSGISFTFHCILADEFAHIQPNILEKFYNNLFPTITAGKAKFIISSTQNGFNLFQRLYVAAENGENDYAPFRVDWWQVPEWNPETHQWDKRDEAWHRRQAANLGGEEAFQAQFGTKFMMVANSLIDSRLITEKLSSPESSNFETKYLPGVSLSESYYWAPDFEPAEDLKKTKIIVTIDIAEGIGQDHTVFMFNRILDMDSTVCVGFFDSCAADPQKAAVSLCECVSNFCDPECTLISVEFNTYGELFVRYILDAVEKQKLNFDESVILKYQIKDSKNFRNGIKMTPSNKPVYCTVFKQKFENGKMSIPSRQFLRQLENFADAKGNGSYQALVGHDDLVMAAIQLVAAQETMRYKYLSEESDPGCGSKNLNYFDFGRSDMWQVPQNPYLDESYASLEQSQKLSEMYRLRVK